MKNKGSTINSKSRLKSVILNDTKEICLKNYLIDLLKEKRTDINEKERNITKYTFIFFTIFIINHIYSSYIIL